jgi:hypothetical protein
LFSYPIYGENCSFALLIWEKNGKKVKKSVFDNFIIADYNGNIMEATLVKQYPEAPLIVAMAESAWAGSRKAAKIEFSLSDNLRAKLKELLGKEVHKIFITDSDVRHIRKHHGQNEEKRGQVDITPSDFALIPVVLNEFDTVERTGEDKLGNKKLLFTKEIEGTIYLASIERGNNQLGVITLWKTKS